MNHESSTDVVLPQPENENEAPKTFTEHLKEVVGGETTNTGEKENLFDEERKKFIDGCALEAMDKAFNIDELIRQGLEVNKNPDEIAEGGAYALRKEFYSAQAGNSLGMKPEFATIAYRVGAALLAKDKHELRRAEEVNPTFEEDSRLFRGAMEEDRLAIVCLKDFGHSLLIEQGVSAIMSALPKVLEEQAQKAIEESNE